MKFTLENTETMLVSAQWKKWAHSIKHQVGQGTNYVTKSKSKSSLVLAQKSQHTYCRGDILCVEVMSCVTRSHRNPVL